mmetsp:Transcript_56996/g.133343  ORF Transcript_56996/g.133343 Transcript_56996/m.133343 type:complete len:536 (+) Transcript_56996:111-1718(+)
MRASLLVVCHLSLAAADSARAYSMMQSRLRGARSSGQTDEDGASPKLGEESSGFATAVLGQRYSDDDESCSAEGISPGVCALASLARAAPARAKEADCDKRESRDRLERALIAEIESALAGNHLGIDPSQLRRLERELEPLYATLQQAEGLKGGLGYSPARYLLHQHFLRQHAWYVRGLNPAGDGRKPPDDKEALRGRVAGHLLEVMENRAGEEGLNLQLLAVFIATLEHLIHGDQRERLKQAWLVHNLQPESTTSGEGLLSVLEVFMAHYVYVSQKVDSGYALTLPKALQEVSTISRIYGGWPQIRSFIREQVEKQLLKNGSPTFEDAAVAADAVLLLFQEVSGTMCHDMERTFQSLKGGERGRVRLSELRAADGGDLFRESVEYLRELGALDETGSETFVHMPNYMLGPSNCDGTTSFYDLCCPNSCESYKEKMEHALMTAEDHLFAINRTVQEHLQTDVPADLLLKLAELAKEHGSILIHGRAFADWLHQVFPRHCPRPREADFRGMAGDMVPDATAEFQATTELKADLFEW